MPNCVVRGCKNQSSKNKKQDGITFHTFPTKDESVKEKWIKVIRISRNEPLWKPSTSSVVCSAHFKDEDMYYSQKGFRRVARNQYPRILPGIPEQLDIDTLFDQDSLYVTTQSTTSTSCTVLPEGSIPEQSMQSVSALNQSSNCVTTVTIQLEEDINNFENAINRNLQKKVSFLEAKAKKYERQIKTLNQKVRRLRMRNKSLKEILQTLKKKKLIGTDLLDSLFEDIPVVDFFCPLTMKKTNNLECSTAMKTFCLTLHYHSPKAYEYVRSEYHTSLPDPKIVEKWYRHIKEEPGILDRSSQGPSGGTEVLEHEQECSLDEEDAQSPNSIPSEDTVPVHEPICDIVEATTPKIVKPKVRKRKKECKIDNDDITPNSKKFKTCSSADEEIPTSSNVTPEESSTLEIDKLEHETERKVDTDKVAISKKKTESHESEPESSLVEEEIPTSNTVPSEVKV